MCNCLPHQICSECEGKARGVPSGVVASSSAVNLLKTLVKWTVPATHLDVQARIERVASSRPDRKITGQDVAAAMSKVGKPMEGL